MSVMARSLVSCQRPVCWHLRFTVHGQLDLDLLPCSTPAAGNRTRGFPIPLGHHHTGQHPFMWAVCRSSENNQTFSHGAVARSVGDCSMRLEKSSHVPK